MRSELERYINSICGQLGNLRKHGGDPQKIQQLEDRLDHLLAIRNIQRQTRDLHDLAKLEREIAEQSEMPGSYYESE